MKNNNKDKYTLGYVFICRGVATKILVGFSIFKGEDGLTTLRDKSSEILGLALY